MMITVHPSHVAPPLLSFVDVIIAIGEKPDKVFQDFSQALGQPVPPVMREQLRPGEAIAWFRDSGEEPFLFHFITPMADHHRHLRKYAEGDLGLERSFYFKGPEQKLNLRAQNLMIFLQLAEGVDDETWLYHLGRGDVSQWLRVSIKDDPLACSVEEVERMKVPAKVSRGLVKKLIEERYTFPS